MYKCHSYLLPSHFSKKSFKPTVRHAGSVWFKNKASLAELYIACTILKHKFQGKYQGQNFKAKASYLQGLSFKGKGLVFCPKGKLNDKDQSQ